MLGTYHVHKIKLQCGYSVFWKKFSWNLKYENSAMVCGRKGISCFIFAPSLFKYERPSCILYVYACLKSIFRSFWIFKAQLSFLSAPQHHQHMHFIQLFILYLVAIFGCILAISAYLFSPYVCCIFFNF